MVKVTFGRSKDGKIPVRVDGEEVGWIKKEKMGARTLWMVRLNSGHMQSDWTLNSLKQKMRKKLSRQSSVSITPEERKSLNNLLEEVFGASPRRNK